MWYKPRGKGIKRGRRWEIQADTDGPSSYNASPATSPAAVDGVDGVDVDVDVDVDAEESRSSQLSSPGARSLLSSENESERIMACMMKWACHTLLFRYRPNA